MHQGTEDEPAESWDPDGCWDPGEVNRKQFQQKPELKSVGYTGIRRPAPGAGSEQNPDYRNSAGSGPAVH